MSHNPGLFRPRDDPYASPRRSGNGRGKFDDDDYLNDDYSDYDSNFEDDYGNDDYDNDRDDGGDHDCGSGFADGGRDHGSDEGGGRAFVFGDDYSVFEARGRRRRLEAVDDGPGEGQRWSTWDQSTPTEKGPQPYPPWLVTELAAVDTELGLIKTGKEADVFLLERGVPDSDRRCLLAAKRYRNPEHRMFHRDAGYIEGRRAKQSRTNRAMAGRTSFGRAAIAGQWAAAEFAALRQLYEVRVPVPYPVQILGTEILLEFVGDPETGQAAPRLAQLRRDTADLPDLWNQLVEASSTMALYGLAHGDLSAFNLLVHDGRLILIDLPQVVDVVANPRGQQYLERDARNVATWFANQGVREADGDELVRILLADARLR